MLLEHQGKRPRIHETAYVAPTSCIVMDDNAVIRGTVRHPEPLNFPRTVFGLERAPAGQTIIPEVTRRRYARALGRHRDDRILDGR